MWDCLYTKLVREPDWGNCVWQNGRVGSGGLGPGDPLPPSYLTMFDSPNNLSLAWLVNRPTIVRN